LRNLPEKIEVPEMAEIVNPVAPDPVVTLRHGM
jgi:hypothetical protein